MEENQNNKFVKLVLACVLCISLITGLVYFIQLFTS